MKNTNAALLKCLMLLALVPAVVTVLTELNKSIVLWRIRIVDLVNLVVLAPFYFVILTWLREIFSEQDQSISFSRLSLGFIALFFYGHAMHLSANAINTYITEVNNYQNLVPYDAYELIYFLDEELGHFLLFTGLFGLFLVCAHSESKSALLLLNRREITWLMIAGAAQGVALGAALIESGFPMLAYVVPVGYAAFLSLILRKRDQRVANYLLWHPFALYLGVFCLSIILTASIYALVFGSFVQPSTLYL